MPTSTSTGYVKDFLTAELSSKALQFLTQEKRRRAAAAPENRAFENLVAHASRKKTQMTNERLRLIGRKEAAAYCGVSPTCFSMWVASHKMPPAISGTRKWDKKAIDAKLDEISGLAAKGGGETELKAWRRRRDERNEERPP
jgi:hypothetical protein